MATRKLLALGDTYAYPFEVPSTDVGQLGQLSLLGISGVALLANANRLTGLADPTAAQDAATKNYVDTLLQGIDRKFNVAALAASNIPLTGLPIVDGYQTVAGDRLLLIGQTDGKQNGIWQVVSSSASFIRPQSQNDYATGTSASGDYVFVQGGNNYAANGYTCNTPRGSDVVDTNPTSWIQFTGAGEIVCGPGLVKGQLNGNSLSVLLATNSGLQFTNAALDHLLSPTGSLSKSSAGLSVVVNTNNTIATDANGLRTLGLPGQFTVAGSAVDQNVTAPNLNTLVDGTASLADALHQHLNVLQAQATVATHTNGSAALSAGDPVQWSSSGDTLARCDAATISTAQAIGVAMTSAAANASVAVIKKGVVRGVLSQATPGAPVYLNVGGGLTYSIQTGQNASVLRIGWAKNSQDMDLNLQYIGQRSA